MGHYNVDKLVKVIINKFCVSKWYKWKNQIKIFGLIFRNEGIYNTFPLVSDNYIGKNPPKNHSLHNYIIYENPEVILYYQGYHSKTYYFNTYKEALAFRDEVISIGNWRE